MQRLKRWSDDFISGLPAQARKYKLADPDCPGLYIIVHPNGSKRWAYRNSEDRLKKLGDFERVSLKVARIECERRKEEAGTAKVNTLAGGTVNTLAELNESYWAIGNGRNYNAEEMASGLAHIVRYVLTQPIDRSGKDRRTFGDLRLAEITRPLFAQHYL